MTTIPYKSDIENSIKSSEELAEEYPGIALNQLLKACDFMAMSEAAVGNSFLAANWLGHQKFFKEAMRLYIEKFPNSPIAMQEK